MLIVLEGCDGSGKSTLATKLAELCDAEIIHCSTETENDGNFFFDIIDASRHRNIIADRFCYGQFVYQNEDDRPLGNYQHLHKVEAEMLRYGAKVIYVTAPTEEIEERLSARGERPINSLSVAEIQDRYADLFNNHSLIKNVLVWNTGKEL